MPSAFLPTLLRLLTILVVAVGLVAFTSHAVPAGVLTAAFDGHHGWFRNRGDVPVTITLTASRAYSDLKRVK